jgi:CO dehydrogenase/acetyl-CoA synthase alpha subunit
MATAGEESDMTIERLAGFAPRTRALAAQIGELQEPCIGCRDCEGFCHVLLDLMNLPDFIVTGAPA